MEIFVLIRCLDTSIRIKFSRLWIFIQSNRESLILETESKMNPTYDISTLIYIHDHKKKTKNYCIDYKHVSKIIYRIETGRYKASNAIQALTKIVFPIGATKNGTRKKHAF